MGKRSFTYSFIVARSRNFVIGCENQMPWRLPSDLKKFKQLTVGKPIIMGRRTFDSIGRALPGRLNIVVSRENGIQDEGVVVVTDKASAMQIAEEEARRTNVSEIMIIGGAEIFRLFDDEVSRVYLTEIDASPRGDAHFDKDFSGWVLKDVLSFAKSPGGDQYDFELKTYERPRATSFRKGVPRVSSEVLIPAE